MNPLSMAKYGLIAVAVIGYIAYSNFSGTSTSYTEESIDLNAVLDVTVDTIYAFEENAEGEPQLGPDETFIAFSEDLAENYNAAQPALHTKPIGVAPKTDASLLAYEDLNSNNEMDQNEDALFLIEVDGENSRVIATSRSGAVNDHHFSGTSLLAGYLIGSMLSRQSAAGVNKSALANKQPVTAKAAASARARAGSGSHSSGK
ncbi:hypothetical protein KO528_02985 [Saccharophagus degradans]|uniref:DUF4340 domain-containing protein n=1 Tax=Saccharophagus degradans TaxID=86304 RepID=A0AAW7X817_9GAMM|nr:hypothetical protein [Saccharophagus degradans]MBU2984305.1 hypothetical protein [Saccharophagus degradans]MDO6422933.1 hypothetical protein [Saccharophagus degradans]MDO6607078.1 hypothetical protein [Saccharophagus degradans]